ncbi:Protein piccolo-like protein [Argiope bruennichi]|uniref:Protein piccolo-like protein n=1 Tax=Argiope bruennichi TaxID=94029 RepID=A0A8T0ER36_ARGBR|nr:Protein piccolo-like protein [Argiope bruennichi]
MGNEESQQQGGGAPGGPPPQQQQAGFGGMGMPRFSGPQPPQQQPRPMGPTGPMAPRPRGPGPPLQQPRGPRPVHPVQVGVQPWAEPPVQQPQRFQPPAVRPLQQQQLQQQQQQQLQMQKQHQIEEETGLDLSSLSEAEKAKILSVMARAQDMDEDYERHKRAKEEAAPQILCPLCQIVDLAVETNKMCGDCGKNFCQKCGTFVPGEGRRSVWVCNTCSNRRKQQSVAMATGQQQDTNTYTSSGQKVAGDSSGRKDDSMSREYHLHPVDDIVTPPHSDTTGPDDYYLLIDDDDDQWTDDIEDRASSIRRMLEDEEEYDSDEGGGGGGSSLQTYYDRSPGEVYTILEEEEEMVSPMMVSQGMTWDGELNPDTASSLLRWRGMGQSSHQPQQQTVQQSVSLIGTSSSASGTGIVSGSLIPNSAVGSIPRTVPLTSLSQSPAWPTSTQPQDQQQQWNLQQAQMVQQGSKPMDMSQGMGMMTQQQQQHQNQLQKQQLKKGEDWSPVTDLSPILDVSPSLEAAEQELMEKCQDQLRPIPRATSGTISGMLADFNKALGLATTPDDGQPQRNLMTATTVAQPPTQQPISGTVGGSGTTQQAVLTSGTEMDQNQNLVQQQFQLQQQQLMIQQQQQVIQQQQQQLQQQVHLQQQMQQQQQLQSQQQQLQAQQQQLQQQEMQQLQQQQQATALAQQQQQQPIGGTAPMQTQSQRKVHRRLPQPTMDQMHAAIAAQTPKSKSRTPSSIGSYQRPVSPIMPSSSSRALYESTSSGLLGVTQSTSSSVSPTPRKDQEGETESGKKIRRRLPPVPLDQEPVPVRRTKDRTRTLSMGAMPLSSSASDRPWERRIPQRTTSLDDGMSLTTTTKSDLDFLGLTTSTDTYLQFLSSTLFGPTTTTTTTSVLASIPSSIGMSTTSMLGRRDLSAPHSLSSYLRTSNYLLDSQGSEGPKLPSYIMSLKQQLRDELRSVTEQRRRITDPDLSGLLSHSSWTDTYDPLRKLGSSTLPPVGGSRLTGGGSASLRRARHRRHASDTKLSTIFPTSASFGREGYDDPLLRYKLYHPSSSMPFKSFEFESIDDHLRSDGLYSQYMRTSYPRRSSLSDTPLTSKAVDSPALRRYNRDMARLRRHTDTGLVFMGLDPYGRSQRALQRKARSWHPSPHASEDEEEREERKAKVKAEIARRRQHIEENSRLHDELYKVARFRDPGGGGYVSPAYGDRLYTSPISLESGGSSQDSARDPDLDQDYFLRNQRYPYSSTFPAYGSHRRSAAPHSSYYTYSPWSYDYADDDLLLDGGAYDYSPLATTDSETDLAPMPLLPDMPTRSRKLLHDLGSTPLGPTYDKHYQQYRSHSGAQYDDYVEDRRPPPPPSGDHQHSNSHLRKAQNSKTSQKYDFPVKRILLTRDPKDRSVSGNGLGMKVVGGKEIPGSNGMIGAYVARIYPGGVVETLGEVREGDQVLEWNGVPLTGKTYEEVQRIIASSGDEVEIVIRSDFNMLSSRSSSHHHHHHQHPQNRLSRSSGGERHGGRNYSHPHQSGGYRSSRSDTDGYNRNYDNEDYYQPPADEGVNNSNYGGSSSPSRGYQGSSRRQQRIVSPVNEKGDSEMNKEKYRAEDISGEIQLQVCHDSKAGILYVTIVRARNLVTSRDNSGLPDPYVICYLLPDRCFENQRRTRYFSRCSNPEWKQTMVYPHVPQDQLKKKHLEISVWNYDINRPPEFLGEVIIDLKDSSVIDEQSRWYKLHPHDPKKYPCQSSSTLNNEGAMKMARLNNPSTQKNSLYFEGADDIRKQQHTA